MSIIHWYLKKQDFDFEKAKIYKEALSTSHGVFLPLEFIWDEIQRRKEDEYSDMFIFTKEDEQELRNLFLKRVESSKNQKEFFDSIHLPRILWTWKQVDLESCLKWMKEYFRDDKNLISFLGLLEGRSISSSGYESKTEYYISVEWMKEFFTDLDALFARVKKIKSAMSEKDERLDQIFSSVEQAEVVFRDPSKKPRRR
ncbi:MAG: hypothetical protein AB7I27_08460 [Bacteriovoracaceae bacterium]